ncbi:hypothetical protein OIU84_002130 [Salix udensis]|uniref:Probable 6-phosphogluconolactonase n=1 Tax=Salix udensis TaxID=889485 RepID=A0AAD6K8C4_9ROSI|nr:hypothetical protein OIU84_002130 [Salix udensis]
MAKAASSLTFYTSLPKLCRPFSISITQPPQVSLNSKKPSCSISSAFKISRRTVTTTKASSMASSGITTVDQNNRKVVEVFVTEEELAVSLAKYTADLSDKFAKERGSFTVVVSGGSLIKSLRKLVEAPYVDSIDWSKWHVFWVDERVVPKDHPDSNYKLAFDGFLSKVPIPSGNVYAINDALSAEGAADDYETRLKHLVHTGMGHVASLFPGHPLLKENQKWVTHITDSPKPPPGRITFTFPVINSSSYIALVVCGAGKASVVQTALGKSQNSDVFPVQMVSPEGELKWFLDKDAASKL